MKCNRIYGVECGAVLNQSWLLKERERCTPTGLATSVDKHEVRGEQVRDIVALRRATGNPLH